MYVIAASFLAFFALIYYYELFGPDVLGVSFEFPFENPKGRLIYARHRAEVLRGPAKELGELLDGANVTANRVGRVVAPPKVIRHALTESCHRKPPSCDTDVSA
jgi:hypothetical protein